MAEHRLERVKSLLREEISMMIMKGIIKDPRVTTMISISDVDVSKDIAYAKIYISGFEGRKKLQSSVDALNHATGFIQGILGKKLKIRQTPKLIFILDNSIEDGFNMIKKIEELNT
ncbi:MAG: 30S ribosome-binding factor RbfA [Spirochaetales bacterium]|nr:30S ribosome-binding factor RbfA [Spirochaetales bacterium]